MGDVRDMLGLAGKRQAAVPPPAAPPAKKAKLPRELQGLVADGWETAMTLVPTHAPARSFKAKRSQTVSWKQMRVKSSARRSRALVAGKEANADDIDLRHWVKIHNMPDYRFSRFNKRVKMLEYNDLEYMLLLQHPQWTRAQTDRLLDLCKKCDLRFLVVHDKFTEAGPDEAAQKVFDDEVKSILPGSSIVPSKLKSVEDLKFRFYSMQKTLLLARNVSDSDLKKNPLIQAPYDPEYETERKEQLERLFGRTTFQMAEVSQLVLENRKITQAIKTLKKQEKERAKILKQQGISLRKKKKSKKLAPQAPALLAPMPPHLLAKRKVVDREPGCYLRSTVLAAMQTAGTMQNKAVETELTSLGFQKTRPFSVPTEKVVTAFENVRNDIITYLNLHKHVTQRESERDALRASSTNSKRKK